MEKLIFWDWTGTLANESKLDEAICQCMEKEIARNEKIAFDQAAKKFRDYLKELENTWSWHDYAHLGQTMGIDWKKVQEQNLEKLKLLPYAKVILRHARKKGYKNILATNAVRQVIQLRINHVGIQDLLDGIIASDDVHAMKAEGRHFKFGLKVYKGDSRSSYSVGDNPIQDIDSASKVGIKTIFCDFGRELTYYHSNHIAGNHQKKPVPDFKIKGLMDIRSII